MSSRSKPEWITGIRSKLDYGWRYHNEHGILSDRSVILDGYNFDVESLLCEKGMAQASIQNCIQCGTCTAVCPCNSTSGAAIAARRMLHEAYIGSSRFESPDIWTCTTCGECIGQCPRGVDVPSFMRVLRRVAVETGIGNIPTSLRWSLTSMAATGNPLGQPADKRADWASGLDIPPFSRGMEALYYPGCLPSYDARIARVARATARILQAAGVRFGILPSNEKCCGEAARRAGNEDLFSQLSEHNTRLFKDCGVTKVLVSSPHCLHAFKNEYPSLAAEVEIVHAIQLFYELMRDSRLHISIGAPRRVTYHDPCYLGRYNNIYDEPREVLRGIPGVELVEMSHHGPSSLCCGGGGGHMWMETPKGERLAEIRIEQAKTTGADVLVTSCPFCLSILEDSLLTNSAGETTAVQDLAELLCDALDSTRSSSQGSRDEWSRDNLGQTQTRR